MYKSGQEIGKLTGETFMFVLEPFQQNAVNNIAARFACYKRVLLQSATGSGKTVMAVEYIRMWLDANPGKNVLCLFNLQCLLPQFEATFLGHGMRSEVSIFHDQINNAKDGSRLVDHQNDVTRRIMLTMPETLAGTLQGDGSKNLSLDMNWFNDVELILIDEAHKGTSENFQFIRDQLPDANILGLTATPMRVKNKEGECLVNDWSYEMVVTVTTQELIDMGRLVKPLYYDLDEDAHLFREWQKAVAIHSAEDGNRQTVWFCKNAAHARDWEEKLREVGETCEVISSVEDVEKGISSQTPNQREAIFKQFERQEITHLISIQALCEGFDAPIAKYCIIDRGVGNKALYQQIVGRVLRPYEGKLNGHVIDRRGNHTKHGDIEDYVWDLEAEAANSVVVRLGEARLITEEQLARSTYVEVKCETFGCPSVYNAKRHVSCPHCARDHGLEVEAAAIVWAQHMFPQFPETMYPNLFETCKKALKGDTTALNRVMKQLDDLLDDDQNLTPKYEMLPELLKVNPKDLKKTKLKRAA